MNFKDTDQMDWLLNDTGDKIEWLFKDKDQLGWLFKGKDQLDRLFKDKEKSNDFFKGTNQLEWLLNDTGDKLEWF